MPHLVVLGQMVLAYEWGSAGKKTGSLVSRLSRSLKVIGTDTGRPATYDFLLVIYCNHGIRVLYLFQYI